MVKMLPRQLLKSLVKPIFRLSGGRGFGRKILIRNDGFLAIFFVNTYKHKMINETVSLGLRRKVQNLFTFKIKELE